MTIHISEEAKRCLQCKRPLCQKGCPVHTPIPQAIQLFMEKRMDEAGELLFANNPMSMICSRVCNYANQCEGSCVRGRKDTPVHFSQIERYVSQAYLARLLAKGPSKLEPNGKRVAVVGSGPAGITVAIRLAEIGCEVTLFEQKMHTGGLLRYGIPNFRLSNELVTEYRELLRALGVKVRPNTTIGGALLIDDLKRDGYDSVFVGTGAWRARKLDIRGQARGNVIFGIDYLANPGSFELGRDVGIIGVGNVAVDVARSALRQGAYRVVMYSNAGFITASPDQMEYAELEGTEVQFGLSVEEINDQGPLFRRMQLDEQGQIIGATDEMVQAQHDTVIVAVSQVPKDKLSLTTEGLQTTDDGLIVVNEQGMTSIPGVFAAGDVVSGPKTVVHAVDGAKLAVEGMRAYMGC
ncbi:MAG: FAD-dependent oxidoreductase [Coriobacteriales bacterium]|nr:FAD-dependent oxidoreductase [Coriobacteriales bacterium]